MAQLSIFSNDDLPRPYDEKDGALYLKVKVTPKAAQNRIGKIELGQNGTCLKVYVAAPPDKGAANKATIDLLSKSFHIPKSKIEIQSGHTSRLKVVKISEENAKNHINKVL